MRPSRARATALAALIVCVLAPFEGAAEAELQPYVGLQGGAHFWPAYSNRDQVEADTGPGFSWSVMGGLGYREAGPTSPDVSASHLLRRLGFRLELEVGQRYSDIHGLNGTTGQLTGDGEALRATSLHLNLWPSVQLASAWRFYIGFGGGATWLRALGSEGTVASYQIGSGVLVDLPFAGGAVRLDIGFRSFWADSIELRGLLTDFDAHGGSVGLQIAF